MIEQRRRLSWQNAYRVRDFLASIAVRESWVAGRDFAACPCGAEVPVDRDAVDELWVDEDPAEARSMRVHFKCGACGATFPADVLPPVDAARDP